MELLSARMNFDLSAEVVPTPLIEEAHNASRVVDDPETAQAIFEKLVPALKHYRANQELAMACGMLVEKQRRADGMLEFWSDLRRVFPEDLTALRMMMRWYRRERRDLQGIAQLHKIFPACHQDLRQAEKAIIGFSELRAFDEIDAMMGPILSAHPKARSIRMRYIKALNLQSRFLDAKDVANQVIDPDKMGASSQTLLDTVTRRAAKMALLYSNDVHDVFDQIVDQLPELPGASGVNGFGAITFFTGQLGTGGAERQLTRIAAAFQDRFQKGELAGGLALTEPVDVCVKHANPASGADFFLPTLRRARVKTTVLTDCSDVPLSQLKHVPAEVLNILELLPEDVFEQTRKLVPYFQERQTQVAYLWQDGGVLAAGLAALLAGVPRIVTSFRGLPPNQRPHRSRPELEPFYQMLAKLPHVTLSSNAQATADAYEDWLRLPKGTVLVVPNAIPPVLPDGAPDDETYWNGVVSRSPDCTQTVLGVFRFDDNKRPLEWILSAAAVAQTHPHVRFIAIGHGYLHAKAEALIQQLDMQDRIFLAGLKEHVGFYLHKADLMLHLAQMEGLPNVLIEAQLAGVPVLATPAGGTDEVVADGETGILLPSADDLDVAEVAQAMGELLSDPAHLLKTGQAALAHAKPRFLLDRVVDQTARLLSHTPLE